MSASMSAIGRLSGLGQPWLGTFAFGDITPNGMSGIFAMPDPHRLCVVSSGDGADESAEAVAELS
jgi:hypothetical protein